MEYRGALLTDMIQGDPGTLEAPDSTQNIRLMPPRELYELWERQQWASHEIDFSQDAADWQGMEEWVREIRIYALRAFYLGEERVTATFTPFVMAAEDPDEEAFCATQLVDEARHAQFFDRFFQAVIGFDEAEYAQRLERARQSVGPAFIELFDLKLQAAVDALQADPGNTEHKVRAITTYHMVIEGTLALTGQRFITDNLIAQGLLPGFVAGFENVARDEHRHVAYGTWYLQKIARTGDKRFHKIVQETLSDLLPVAAQVLLPPRNISQEQLEELSGVTLEEQQQYAFKSLSRRMKAIGIGLPGTEPS